MATPETDQKRLWATLSILYARLAMNGRSAQPSPYSVTCQYAV